MREYIYHELLSIEEYFKFLIGWMLPKFDYDKPDPILVIVLSYWKNKKRTP